MVELVKMKWIFINVAVPHYLLVTPVMELSVKTMEILLLGWILSPVNVQLVLMETDVKQTLMNVWAAHVNMGGLVMMELIPTHVNV